MQLIAVACDSRPLLFPAICMHAPLSYPIITTVFFFCAVLSMNLWKRVQAFQAFISHKLCSVACCTCVRCKFTSFAVLFALRLCFLMDLQKCSLRQQHRRQYHFATAINLPPPSPCCQYTSASSCRRWRSFRFLLTFYLVLALFFPLSFAPLSFVQFAPPLIKLFHAYLL